MFVLLSCQRHLHSFSFSPAISYLPFKTSSNHLWLNLALSIKVTRTRFDMTFDLGTPPKSSLSELNECVKFFLYKIYSTTSIMFTCHSSDWGEWLETKHGGHRAWIQYTAADNGDFVAKQVRSSSGCMILAQHIKMKEQPEVWQRETDSQEEHSQGPTHPWGSQGMCTSTHTGEIRVGSRQTSKNNLSNTQIHQQRGSLSNSGGLNTVSNQILAE